MARDGRKFYLTTSEVHPGERHLYTLPIDGGARTKITSMAGSNQAEVSPDESTLGLVFSYSNKPPEVYVMPNAAGAQAIQVTTTPTEAWRSFKWIDPKVITFKARDGVDVYARLFTPEMIGARRDATRPGVVFVHGAGYLQNAHKYWSTYFREYMFHNLLAARGYVVLDVDYRASSGYGRDWRTAIYRFMGGKDLEDIVDGAKYLTTAEKVDPKRIGVYGGSYGGFITLMAMFTTPDVFAAGAALRPVTDWAHYNHGYTSNILNKPQKDAEAYRKSSPIYFAEGLKGALLICHGMVDTNVHFQDSVRLVQRLIELRKENWELAAYPVENHGFTEETSWADEYKRILKLFDDNLRQPGREGDQLMDQETVLDLFRKSGALLEGHFRLSSGLHSDRYLQSALVLQYPEFAGALGHALADRTRHMQPTVVLSPALGGIVIGQEVGRALGVRAIFAERQEGALVLRRGFTLDASDRVLVVEDVITTGGSTRETIAVAEALGAQVTGAAAIIDRGSDPARLNLPMQSLVRLEVPTYAPEACPLCAKGVPIVKPGSRAS